MVTEVFIASLTLLSSYFLFDFLVQSRKCTAAGNPHPSAQALPKSHRERIGDGIWLGGEKWAIPTL